MFTNNIVDSVFTDEGALPIWQGVCFLSCIFPPVLVEGRCPRGPCYARMAETKRRMASQQLLKEDVNIDVEGFGKCAKLLEREKDEEDGTNSSRSNQNKRKEMYDNIRNLECSNEED